MWVAEMRKVYELPAPDPIAQLTTHSKPHIASTCIVERQTGTSSQHLLTRGKDADFESFVSAAVNKEAREKLRDLETCRGSGDGGGDVTDSAVDERDGKGSNDTDGSTHWRRRGMKGILSVKTQELRGGRCVRTSEGRRRPGNSVDKVEDDREPSANLLR